MTTVKVGERLPVESVTFKTVQAQPDGTCARPTDLPASKIFAGKTVVVVSLPGAFTPVCTGQHVPGFLAKLPALKAAKCDDLVITAVNDAFVMGAWVKELGGLGKVTIAADWSGDFVKKLGLEADLSARGLGMRGQRFAMIVRDGTIRYLGVDGEELKASSADAVLAQLQSSK